MKNYFVCPDYDGQTNIQKAKIEYIDFDYWEGCETGGSECKPLTFSRTDNVGYRSKIRLKSLELPINTIFEESQSL